MRTHDVYQGQRQHSNSSRHRLCVSVVGLYWMRDDCKALSWFMAKIAHPLAFSIFPAARGMTSRDGEASGAVWYSVSLFPLSMNWCPSVASARLSMFIFAET